MKLRYWQRHSRWQQAKQPDHTHGSQKNSLGWLWYEGWCRLFSWCAFMVLRVLESRSKGVHLHGLLNMVSLAVFRCKVRPLEPTYMRWKVIKPWPDKPTDWYKYCTCETANWRRWIFKHEYCLKKYDEFEKLPIEGISFLILCLSNPAREAPPHTGN